MKYDIVIAHRVCPALSKTAVGFDEKRSMVVATTESLAESLKGLTVRLIVILDGCPGYDKIFTDAFGANPSVKLEIENTDAIGNQATWGRQLELLCNVTDSKYVYFSEDDYIYHPDAFRAMLDFAKCEDVDFVTPLDHPDRYTGRLEKPTPSAIRVSEFRHWREVSSSCLTFLAKAKIVSECKSIMESFLHSPEEATMWLGITKHEIFRFGALFKAAFRYFILRRKCGFGELMGLCTWKRQGLKLLTKPRRRLFSPIPSLAVHLANCSLPPGSGNMLKRYFSLEKMEEIQELERKVLSAI